MPLRVLASRHSAFYSPLLIAVELLRKSGVDAAYGVLEPGQHSHALIRDGVVDVMQSAVSTNWGLMERGIEPRPVHFAQINRRDGFFLVAREPDPHFHWKQLEGHTLLADHGLQPLVMMQYAAAHNGVDWNQIKVVDAGTPEQMEAAFGSGVGDYLQLQAPVVAGQVVASVGASMPPVAFSSLCCSREFLNSESHQRFLDAFTRAKEWVRTSPAGEIAAAEASFFPNNSREQLAAAIERYQRVGCWDGGTRIPRDLYEQALDVFLASGRIHHRHAYEDVVA